LASISIAGVDSGSRESSPGIWIVEADKKAGEIRKAIDDGTFERTADRRAREQREAGERAGRERTGQASPATVITLDQYAKVYIERAAAPSGKVTWKDDEYLWRGCVLM
jgi:hypothetical protein